MIGINIFNHGGGGGASPVGVLHNDIYLNQYISYNIGDTGDRVQAAWNNFNKPTTPQYIAELRNGGLSSDFFVLKAALQVGGNRNVQRFVDVDGLQVFGATGGKNRVFIDKLTNLMCTRLPLGSTTFANHCTNALTHTEVVNGVTYSDFRLASLAELLMIFGNNRLTPAQIDPVTGLQIFALANNTYHTSDTYGDNTAFSNGCFIDSNGLSPTPYNKGNSGAAIFLRKATGLIS